MANRSSYLKAFNTHFFEFLNDVMQILPSDPEITKAKTSFETIKKMNPTILCKAWMTYVYGPYKEVIDNGDISFFYDKDYGADVANLPEAQEIMAIIDKIRQPIKSMDETNKQHCTKYIQNLSKLSLLYSQC
jgi:hypothetical protein